MPFLVVGLAEMLAGADFFSQVRRKVCFDEAPHFVAERFFFGVEVEVHRIASLFRIG